MLSKVTCFCLSLALFNSCVAQAQNRRSPQIEQQCNLVIREVRTEIWQRHSVAVVAASQDHLSTRNWRLPVDQSGRVLTRRYKIVLSYNADPNSTQRSINFLRSPVTLRTYAQKIRDRCRPVAMVIFGLDQTTFGVDFGVDNKGRMFMLECTGYGFGDPRNPKPMPWGRTICDE